MKNNSSALDSQLDALHLPFCKEHCHPSAAKAAKDSLTHLEYFTQLIEGEAATITSAVLDRLLHRGHTVVIEGPSYRMKDRSEN